MPQEFEQTVCDSDDDKVVSSQDAKASMYYFAKYLCKNTALGFQRDVHAAVLLYPDTQSGLLAEHEADLMDELLLPCHRA